MIYIFTLDDPCTPEQGSAIHDCQQVVMYGKFVYGGDGEAGDELQVSEHPILKDKLYHFIYVR